ncbi:hypothetical protein LX32DRAFT_257932 [Colletotrichum zoysiae]|uniref:Uncharacterized protein n=1 Tax=Colletotrichum zoysiae TaxID=1216348 RepID=A0AAD9HPB7_9PEZI|nr:hypothetical protein LX32DRAFT_257932 [Colletotrichum zoysiae]
MPSLVRYLRTSVSYRRCPRVPRGADLVCVLMSCVFPLELGNVAFGVHVVLLSRRILHIVVTLRAQDNSLSDEEDKEAFMHQCGEPGKRITG